MTIEKNNLEKLAELERKHGEIKLEIHERREQGISKKYLDELISYRVSIENEMEKYKWQHQIGENN